MEFAIAMLIKPFAMFVLTALVLYPARMAVKRHMQEGRLKDVLLFRIGGQGVRWTPKVTLIWVVFLVSYLAFLIRIALT